MDKDIKSLLKVELPTIPLHIFTEVYLPLVLKKDTSLFPIKWLNEVSKNIYLEVEVLDIDGKVLFNVPSLAEPSVTTLDTTAQHILSLAAMEVHQIQVEAKLRKGLPAITNFKNNKNISSELRWREILTICGYEKALGNISLNKEDHPANSNNISIEEDDSW